MGWFDRFRRPDVPALPVPEQRADAAALPAGATVQNALTWGGVPGIDKGASNVLVMRTPWFWTELETLYRQMGLAYRIVNAFPRAALAAWWDVDVGEDRDVGEPVDVALRIRERLAEALVDARLYGMSCLLMVTEGMQVPAYGAALDLKGPLAQPMGAGERVVRLQEYAAFEMAPIQYGADPRSEYYRQPEIWQLAPMDGLGGPVMVHASRIVTFSGAVMTRRIRRQWYGRDFSVLELYRDALLRRDRIDSGAATLAEEMVIKALKIAGYRGMVTGTIQQRTQAIGIWQTMLRSLGVVGAATMDTTDELQVHSATAAGFDALEATSRRAISEVEGVPQTEWFGDTPSGLNTDNESARKAWARRVEEYETQQLRDPLTRLYTAALGAVPGSVKIRFRPVEPMTETERAALEKLLADRDAVLVGAGVVSPDEVRGRLRSTEPTTVYVLDDSLIEDLTDDPTEDDATEPDEA